MTSDYVRELLASCSSAFAPTGSRVICNPAPTDTDEDFVCLATSETEFSLMLAGFDRTTPQDDRYAEIPEFVSYRRDAFNIILTENADFYARFVEATDEAKRLNLLEKSARIELFQRVLYGVTAAPGETGVGA